MRTAIQAVATSRGSSWRVAMGHRTRGISFIELLMAITIMAIALTAVSRTFAAGLEFESKSGKTRELITDRLRVENEIRQLIAGANLHGDTTYLIAPIPTSTTTSSKKAASSNGANSNGANATEAASNGGTSETIVTSNGSFAKGAESLVFTTTAPPLPVSFLTAPVGTFESANERFGAMGGNGEVAFSMTPVGDAGSREGLFLRRQRPADSNPSAGGEEEVLDPSILDIRFEFYDGSAWVDSWNSQTDNKGKLPLAVRVTYETRIDHAPHMFIAPVPLNDSVPTSTQGSGSNTSGDGSQNSNGLQNLSPSGAGSPSNGQTPVSGAGNGSGTGSGGGG